MGSGKTEKLTALIEKRIRSGDWPVGEYIPAMRKIALDEGVSRSIVAAALSILVGRGYLECVPRQGYRIISTKGLDDTDVSLPSDDGQSKRLLVERCVELFEKSKKQNGGRITDDDRSMLVKSFGGLLYDRFSDAFSGLHVGYGGGVSGEISSVDEVDEGWPSAKYTFYECNLTKETSVILRGTLLNFVFSPQCVSFDDRTMEYVNRRVHPNFANEYLSVVNREKIVALAKSGDSRAVLEYREGEDEKSMRWVRLTVFAAVDQKSRDIMARLVYQDIDEEKRRILRQKEMFAEDALTGVFTRKSFVLQCNELLAGSTPESQHAFLMIDIDGFKSVNDRFGHPFGDAVLTDVAKGMRSVLRHGDIVGRIGGDEFIVCLKNIPFDSVIEKRAKQINTLMRRTFENGTEVSGSVGIAVYPRDGHTLDELYRNSDIALYCAKDMGKDTVVFYQHGMALRDGQIAIVSDDSESEGGERKKKVLIVDDDEISRAVMVEALKDDYIFIEAVDGSQGLNILRRFSSDISAMLLDLTMPRLSGFDVLKSIQEDPLLCSVPVIVVSASGDAESEMNAIKLGAIDYVSKPIDPRLIRLRVKNAVTRHENEKLRMRNSYLQLQSDEEARYRYIIESTSTIVVEYDCINAEFTYDKSIGLFLAGQYDSRPLWAIFEQDDVTSAHTAEEVRTLISRLSASQEEASATLRLKLKGDDGQNRWYKMNAYCSSDETRINSKIIITFNDINEDVLADEQLLRVAEIDPLTGLYNREAFLKRVRDAVINSPANSFVICYADIDNFKRINGLYGHSEGNLLLKYIADNAQKALRGDGFCGRIFSDVFAGFFPNDEAVIEKLNRDFSSILSPERLPYDITMTFGLYVIDNPLIETETLLDRAALAQRSIKGVSDRWVAYYDADMQSMTAREQRTVDSIGDALRGRQFEVYFQPIVDYKNHRIISAEALVRWHNPSEGLMLPSEFVSIFERNGMLMQMDNYVWESTCELLKRWRDEDGISLSVSFNLSQVNLHNSSLIDTISSICEKHGVSPSLIRFEINESAYSNDSRQFVSVIDRLRAKGFLVEIDNFGSGLSSLNLLSDIQADILKLDMRFVDERGFSGKAGTLLTHLIEMADSLGFDVVAKGIESFEQAEFLRSIGCDMMQGYYFARPMNAEALKKLLTS